MITEIYIEGLKSIKKQQIDLRKINIFIGGNGVGKSNFISAFSLLRAVYEKQLAEYVIKKGGANNLLYFGTKNTQRISFDINFNSINRFMLDLEQTKDTLFVKSTDTAFLNNVWHYKNFEKNVRESNFKNINHNQAYWVNPLLQEFEVYHFHDTGENSPIKGYSKLNDNRFLRKDGSNIPAFLYYLKEKHPKHFLRIERTITSVAPFFDGFNLNPDAINEQLIKIEWREKGMSDAYFDAYSLSDGTLRFICLVTLLMQPNPPKTIIIDEPELGLHPVAINKLASLMRKAANHSQLIVSTQSINLIDNFEPDDIMVVDRIDNETVFNRLKNDELRGWLQEYSLGDIWGKNIVGGQPFSH